MTQRESDAIVTYLHAARVDWLDKVQPTLLAVWFDALKLFPAAMAQQAVKGFHAQRHPQRQGFAPDIGEIVGYLDRCWHEHILAEHQRTRQDEAGSAQRLLGGTGPRGAVKDLASDCQATIARMIGQEGDPVIELRAIMGRWSGDFHPEIVESAIQSIEHGREAHQLMVAGYHAQGTARYEPCSSACEHGAGIPLSKWSGGIQ